MRGFFACWEHGFPDCTCFFKYLTDLKTHQRLDHKKELVIVG